MGISIQGVDPLQRRQPLCEGVFGDRVHVHGRGRDQDAVFGGHFHPCLFETDTPSCNQSQLGAGGVEFWLDPLTGGEDGDQILVSTVTVENTIVVDDLGHFLESAEGSGTFR